MTSKASNSHLQARTVFNLAGKRLHFVGIGGSGMSGLARICHQRDAVCSGSDLAAGEATAHLEAMGIKVDRDQTGQAIGESCDLMIASAAIKPDHPELRWAEQNNVRVLKYAEMLGELMRGQIGVAVAGTHGKSSTTSMLSFVTIECGLDPSLIVGANCRQIGGGSRVGQSDIVVAEACEYDRSFHHLHPKHAVILNIEEDHLDCYASLEAIIASFHDFARLIPDDGSLLISHGSPHRLAVTAGLTCGVETIGFSPQADWQVVVEREEGSQAVVRLLSRGEVVTQWHPLLPGDHMAYNAAVAAVLAHRLGAEWSAIGKALSCFEGLDRRMQRLGVISANSDDDAEGITVLDDYGHHPTEVDTTLRAIRQHYQPKRLICVFQPHQHSRTRFLMEQFAMSFSEADLVLVPHIYFVRDSETERRSVSAGDFVDALLQQNVQAMHLYPLSAITDHLRLIMQPGDLIVTMGAGDVWQVSHDLVG